MNLTTYPLEDGFETTLSQSWDGSVGTINVNSTPSFTFPAGVKTYVVVNPTNSKLQIAEVDSYDAVAKTLNVTSITTEKGASVASTQNTHPVNSTLIISDNFQFWSDIATAINSKLDNDGGNTTTTFDLQVSGSLFRIRLDGSGNMQFTDDNNVEISLSTISAAAGADRKVAATLNDTTPGNLTDKLTVSDGLITDLLNPGGNEQYEVSVGLSTSNGLKFTGGLIDIEPATNTQVGTQRIATDIEAEAGVLEGVSINPKQALENSILKSTTAVGDLEFVNGVQSNITIAHGLGKIPRKIIAEMGILFSTTSDLTAGTASYDGTTIIQKTMSSNGVTDPEYRDVLFWNNAGGSQNHSSWAISAIDDVNITLTFAEVGNSDVDTIPYKIDFIG